jgi:hypothetical protein
MNANRDESAGKKTLADTLLDIDNRMPSSTTGGREIAKQVLRRDQQRVRILTWMTVGFFLLTVIGIGLSIFWYYIKVVPIIDKYQKEISVTGKNLANQEPLPESQLSKQEPLGGFVILTASLCQVLYRILFVTILGISVLFMVMLAAAFCTVLLIMASRRATLGQIQASLLALSEQFDTLQRSLHADHSTGGGQAAQKT